MRTLRLLTVAALVSPAVGCNWMKEWRDNGQPRPTGKIPDVTAEQLVGYLNDRAGRLQSIEYGNTRARVSGKGMPIPATLDGNLAAAQPRNFRMVSSARVASAKVDMGSNPDEFWVYVAAPGDQPVYVYSSHADFESGKARLPGGIPFEPDWVMQALGMTTFPPTNRYEVAVNERDRTYTLWWLASNPSAGQVRKEVVFDADQATGTRPQVKKHLIRDAKGTKVIASAEVKAAERAQSGADPRSPVSPVSVQYPTHIILKWEQQGFEMDLTLEKAHVNQAEDASRRAALFNRPDIRGATPIDLARYESPAPR